jgi:hypothetical protein
VTINTAGEEEQKQRGREKADVSFIINWPMLGWAEDTSWNY